VQLEATENTRLGESSSANARSDFGAYTDISRASTRAYWFAPERHIPPAELLRTGGLDEDFIRDDLAVAVFERMNADAKILHDAEINAATLYEVAALTAMHAVLQNRKFRLRRFSNFLGTFRAVNL